MKPEVYDTGFSRGDPPLDVLDGTILTDRLDASVGHTDRTLVDTDAHVRLIDRGHGCSFFRRLLTKKSVTILDLHFDSLNRPTPMTSTKSVKTIGPKRKAQPELTEDEQRELAERNNQIREQRAETQLQLAKLFVEKEKPDIARRRLKEIVTEFSGTEAAKDAKALIKKL